jgi:Heterokaryon incompatibility protein (HET)
VANLHISLFSDSLAARNKDVVGVYTGEDVLSDGNIRMLSTWLQNCLSHTKCCQTMSGGKSISARQAPLPTRCVEVLATGLRLRETGSKVGSYITLSHRWTTEAALCCTTADNIDSRRGGNADWSRDLPKTFLDTFDLARRLRVKYVWVDSLCIIQHGDDGADWQQESVRMADYYQHSLLTIAATSGSRDDGLIPPKTILPPQLARLPYRDSNGCRHGFFYVYSYNLEVDKQYQSFIQESELLSRGWVFQEWLLSRRIVYFTPSGAFYECQERDPYNDRGEVSKTMSEDNVPAAVKQLAKNSFVFETASISRLWYQIVQSYSALLLTKPEKDRIVALAGVAKEFRETMTRAAPETGSVSVTVKCGLQYVSGLWLRDLHRGLLWERKPSNLEPQRIPQLPTWSWASILCPVLWDDEHDTRTQPEAKVIAVVTSQEDVYSIDSLQSSRSSPKRVFDVDNQFASLYMLGKMVQVLVWERFTDERDLEIASATSGHRVDSAKNIWRTVCSGLLPTEIAGWVSFEDPDYLDDSLFQDGLEIYVLHISTISRLPGGYGLGYLTPWHNVFNVLFVRKVEGEKYNRVGVGRLFGKEIERQFCTATAQYVKLI